MNQSHLCYLCSNIQINDTPPKTAGLCPDLVFLFDEIRRIVYRVDHFPAVRQNCRRLRGRENRDGLGRERIRAQKEPHLHDGRAREADFRAVAARGVDGNAV